MARVELDVDAYVSQVLTAPPYLFTLDTTWFTNGAHTVKAVAYDSLGFSAEDPVGVVMDNIFPPLNLTATRSINRSLLLREYVNVLTWADNSRNTGVMKYRIYRVAAGSRALVAEVPKAGSNTTYRYLHRRIDRTEVYTYEVVGVNDHDREGLAVSTTAK